MDGNPTAAAQTIHRVRGTLSDVMLTLMGREDIQDARRRLSEVVTDVQTAISELDSLARVNGLAEDPFALAGKDDGSGPDAWEERPVLPVTGEFDVIPVPPPDPDRKPAATLLSNPSLASFEPELPPGLTSSDLQTDLVPWSEHGGMLTGPDQGVRVTHVPTGICVISSRERSQLQNKARAVRLLATHPDVEAYVRDQRCTHGADCPVHPGTRAPHDFFDKRDPQ